MMCESGEGVCVQMCKVHCVCTSEVTGNQLVQRHWVKILYCGCVPTGEVHAVPHSSIEAVKTLVVKFCSSFPPTKMISPVVSCVVAAKYRGTGRSPLDILTHELKGSEPQWANPPHRWHYTTTL